MKEVNLFTYCGSSQMKEKLWRDMFIAHIFGVDMPGDIEVRRLSDSIKNGISGKEFSPALASLLMVKIIVGNSFTQFKIHTQIYLYAKEQYNI